MAGKPGMHSKHHLGEQAQEKLRTKIKAGVILDRLVKHVTGEIEMTPSQVQSGLGLMRKVLPDLAATELSGSVTTYQDTLRRVAEQMGWAVAAAQVRDEAVDNSDDIAHVAVQSTDNESDAMSDVVQSTD